MRYIGNKTKLLPFILGRLRALGIPAGTAHDAFAGTASVGRALKAAGWRVHSSDLMEFSYVLQRAYVVASRTPSLADLRAAVPEVAAAFRDPRARKRARDAGAGAPGMLSEFLSFTLAPVE